MEENKPRLLDLFCCEGGAAMGYHRAGFEIVGVDIDNKADRYPFPFIRGDALEFLSLYANQFDVIHASPPCQMHSVTKSLHKKVYEDLVEPTRDALEKTGLPWVIENVEGAPLRFPITLCGASFDLTATDTDGTNLYLRRHRLFESNLFLKSLPCKCRYYDQSGYEVGGVYGKGTAVRMTAKTTGLQGGGYVPSQTVIEDLVGIDWMSSRGLTQCIPPAYTEYLGKQLLELM